MGEYDVLVGINLLREGLDLPEVSLVAILDADKEGFLRSAKSLIQTIGRAARNVSGEVHMYADSVTDSMAAAIDETNRRREKQVAYNLANGIDPQPIRKKIADITDMLAREDADTERAARQRPDPQPGQVAGAGPGGRRTAARRPGGSPGMPAGDLADLVQQLTDQMHARGRGPAVRAGRPAARRDLRPEEGAAADGRGHPLALARPASGPGFGGLRAMSAGSGQPDILAVGGEYSLAAASSSRIVRLDHGVRVGQPRCPGWPAGGRDLRDRIVFAEPVSEGPAPMDVHLYAWIITVVVMVLILAFDIFIIGRRPHEPSMRRPAPRSASTSAWPSSSGSAIWAISGPRYAGEFFAGWLTEYSLSIDNLFIFLIIMSSLKVPRQLQQFALMVGIILALIFRGIFIAVGAAAINRFSWVFFIFGAFLLYTAVKLVHGLPAARRRGGGAGQPGAALRAQALPVHRRLRGHEADRQARTASG